MSGSGGGSYVPEGGGTAELDCDIVRTDALASPIPEVVNKMSKGDVCDVVLDDSGGRSRVHVVYKGEIAGVLLFQGFIRLIECMRRGHDYVAVVQSRRGGWCEVEIRPAP